MGVILKFQQKKGLQRAFHCRPDSQRCYAPLATVFGTHNPYLACICAPCSCCSERKKQEKAAERQRLVEEEQQRQAEEAAKK